MEIFSELNDNPNLSIALGYFDGVHKGHQKVIKTAVDYAHINNVKSAVITFKDHPCCYLWNVSPKYILTRNNRRQKIEELGIDYLYELDFRDISEYTANDYMRNIIIKHFAPIAISTGFNHNFGFNKTGNTNFLSNSAQIYNYKYFLIEAQKYNDTVISSTIIRELLSAGKIQTANHMLGFNFFIEGTVVKGKQIGRTIGFRTANINYPDELINLPYGVYATLVYIDNICYYGITNFGINPTLSSDGVKSLETHILNFENNIYNKKIRVEFMNLIRYEMKFKSVNDLKLQIQKDIDSIGINNIK